jgi:asparagine synthase (glutamine-hydrolysing)
LLSCVGDLGGRRRAPRGNLAHLFWSDAQKAAYYSRFDCHDPGMRSEGLVEAIWRECGSADPRNAVAAVDFEHQLPEEFLFVTDRFSMAHSLEVRVPFLDHQLVEAVFRLPPRLRTGGDEPKSFFRGMVRHRLPAELAEAPKRGFVLPLSRWLRGPLKPLVEEHLSEDALQRCGVFSKLVRRRVVERFLRGDEALCQHVWTVLMFQVWDAQRPK